MKQVVWVVLTLFSSITNAQFVLIDSINFQDTLKFERTIDYNSNGQLSSIKYQEIYGNLELIEFYSDNRIQRAKIWRDTLLHDIKYTRLEKGQVLERFDVLNQKKLDPMFNFHLSYPFLARENEIEGVVQMRMTYNDNCLPISFEVLNKLGYGIDEEVTKHMNRLIKFAAKYDIYFRDCQKSNGIFEIKFQLE